MTLVAAVPASRCGASRPVIAPMNRLREVPGVEHDARIVDAGLAGDFQRPAQEQELVFDGICQLLALPPRMHDHQPRPGIGRHPGDARLALEPPHIVDDMRACRHRQPCCLFPVCVHGKKRPMERSQRLDYRQDSLLLLGCADGRGHGAGGFAPDIDDRRALPDHHAGLRHRLIGRGI
jgi:hypothetical protein